MEKQCAIIVPVYTTQLGFLEVLSLKRTIQMWGNTYDIILMGPEGLDYTTFKTAFNYDKFKVAQFDPKYFKTTLTYSELLIQPGFYQTFLNYEFLQIAQLDTYVFSDKLEYFMSLDYDYIGGLHNHYNTEGKLEMSVGNGGFSLRKTKACLSVLLNYTEQIAKYPICEDRIFGEACANVLNVAPKEIAKTYSYHDEPRKFYEESGHVLPMGAHAINKHIDFYYDKMETYPLVSVIVPVYNMEKYVLDTLNSIRTQTYENWECIIINDGSTDSSEDIILKFIADKPKFKYIHQANAGVAAARNNAIRFSKGKYILPVDPDDVILTGYIKDAVSFMETHSNYALYYSNAIFYGVNGANFFKFSYRGYEDLLKQNRIHNSSLYKKSDFDRIGGYNEKLKGYEDWEFYIRLLYHNDKVFTSDMPYCLFRTSDSSRNATAMKTHSAIVKSVIDANTDIFKEYNLSFNNPHTEDGISILISAYKVKDLIRETLDSIYAQSYIKNHSNFEVLVGVDGDVDTLLSLQNIDTVYPNLRVFMMDTNMGAFPTANALLKNARYNKIMRFDADDTMEDNMLEKIMLYAKKYDIVRYGYYEWYPEENKKTDIKVLAYGSVLYDKKVFNAAGGYVDWKCSGDYEFYWRVCDRFSIGEIHEPLYSHRNRSESLLHSPETSMDSEYRKMVNAKVRRYASNESIYITPVINNYRSILLSDFREKKAKAIQYAKARHYNIDNPTTLQEKITWLNINDYSALKTYCADKITVKDYCKTKLGVDLSVPLIGVYNTPDEIVWDKLPQQFVIKANHGSNMNIVVKDKSTLNIANAKKEMNKWLVTNYTDLGYELHYYNIVPKILIEEYIGDNPADTKVWCFNGEIKFIGRELTDHNTPINFYDENYNLLPLCNMAHPRNPSMAFEKPLHFEEMKEYAKIISSDFKLVRVDFYESNNKVYLGELTFTPGNANFRYKDPNDEIKYGNMLQL